MDTTFLVFSVLGLVITVAIDTYKKRKKYLREGK